MKEYIIKIEIIHTEEDGEESVCASSCIGSYSYSPECCEISYTDVEGDMAGSTVTITVRPDGTAEIGRCGEFGSQLVLERGVRHSNWYKTPYGNISVGTYANIVDPRLDAQGGTLRLRYAVDFNSDSASVNDMTLTVKEV